MQERPCDCSPMCVLRARNPVRLRPSRAAGTGFGAGSSYRVGPVGDADHLARRLAEYVVLSHDPAVPLVAADYWQHSQPFYRAVVDQARLLAGSDRDSLAAFDRLTERPADVTAETRLESELARLLARQPERAVACAEAVRTADDNVYIGYLRGAGYQSQPIPVTLGSLRESAAPPPSRPAREAHQIAVIVPIMDRDGTARVRNLVACLMALRDQTFDSRQVAITVVEFDTVPRWRTVLAPLADHYVHVLGAAGSTSRGPST